MTKVIGNKMNQALASVIKHWGFIAPVIKRPKTTKEYDHLVNQLDQLLDIVGDNENHTLMGLVDLMSHLIAEYDGENYQDNMGKGIDALKFLMEEHQLGQSDLPEVASQGVMSEILRGKRPLNVRQIKLLAERFNVDPSTFID